MKQLPILLCTLLLAVLLIPACEVENCPSNALAYSHFTLQDGNGRNVSFTTAISVIGEIDGQDTVMRDTIINQESEVSSFSLPLSYGEETRFIIVYSADSYDTITVRHRNIPYFLNIDCGTMMFHEIQNVQTTRHAIDSIAITNPNIDNNEKENFKIYFPIADAN